MKGVRKMNVKDLLIECEEILRSVSMEEEMDNISCELRNKLYICKNLVDICCLRLESEVDIKI